MSDPADDYADLADLGDRGAPLPPTKRTPEEALEAYLGGRGIAWLAEQIGVDPSTLTRQFSGARERVSLDNARDIERVTAGAVTAEEWLALCATARRNREMPSAASPELSPSAV
ncbi:MAG: hypothetical protein ACJ8AD_14755 [Gemmatimonadaceae bacterium]